MINKKRKRELNDDENPNDLHKNLQLLEYQNKCLVGLVADTKRVVEEKHHRIQDVDTRNQKFVNLFANLGFELVNLNHTIVAILNQYNLNLNLINVGYNIPLDLLNNIFKSDIFGNEEEIKEITEPITQNVKILINYLAKLITNLNEIKIRSDSDITNDNEILEIKNLELLNNMSTFTEEKNNLIREIQLYKSNIIKYQDDIRKKDLYINELNEKIKNLNIKIKSHPIMPYINYTFDKIGDHECICHICGDDMKKEVTIIQPTIQNTNNLENEYLNENERLILEHTELEEYKKQNLLFISYIEKIKMEMNVTEERFLLSKPFQYLLSQAESMLKDIESLREMNLELQRQKNDILKEKDVEVRIIENKLHDIFYKQESKISELIKRNEHLDINNQTMNLKIENLQNLLKAKETLDANKLYQEFEEEKNKLSKQIEYLRSNKIESDKQFEALCEQIENFEKNIFRLNQEVEKYKISLSKYENLEYQEGLFVPKFDKFDQKEREEMKRSIRAKKEFILNLEKKNHKLKNQLLNEKENSEKLIADLELNEKGFEELNKKNKILLSQLQESNEKMAKMTNEKTKDLHTIKLLNDEKDILERRIKEQENSISSYIELNKKLDQEILILKEIRMKEDIEIKFKNDEIENLKKNVLIYIKSSEEYKSAYDLTLSALNIAQTNSSKNLSNYEQLNIKYENLCKIKKMFTETNGDNLTYDELSKENNIKSIEIQKYRDILRCKVCKTRNKDVILQKCFHTFCKECIDATIKSRYRICPMCKLKIGDNDIKTLFLD